ncbi:MAG: hypothetical protein R3F54_28690 [Alphaproteobacteria bacterium]
MDQRKLDVMLELDRRGELPARQAEVLAELKSRGVIQMTEAAQGGAADPGFPGPDPAGAAGTVHPGRAALASILGLSLPSAETPGVESSVPRDEGAGVLDYLGALPGIAQALDIKDMVTQGVEPSDQFPYFSLPQSISDRRELGDEMLGYGEMLVGGPVAGRAVAAGGRVAAEFAPDIAGGLLGGSVGGSFIPGLGHMAGSRMGARAAADLFKRGKGIRSRVVKALKGNRRGSAPIEKTDLPSDVGSNAERHAQLVRELLEAAQ